MITWILLLFGTLLGIGLMFFGFFIATTPFLGVYLMENFGKIITSLQSVYIAGITSIIIGCIMITLGLWITWRIEKISMQYRRGLGHHPWWATLGKILSIIILYMGGKFIYCRFVECITSSSYQPHPYEMFGLSMITFFAAIEYQIILKGMFHRGVSWGRLGFYLLLFGVVTGLCVLSFIGGITLITRS